MSHQLPPFDPDLFLTGNRMLDFGPPLAYPLLCSAYTVEKLTLWNHSTDNVFESIAIKAPHMPRARIEGNLYRVTDEEMKKLDTQRALGVQYDRKRLPVYVPFRDEQGNLSKIYAWVYLGCKDNWVDQIDFGSNHRTGWYRNGNQEFKLADRVSHNDKLLHNRFALLKPLQEATSVAIAPKVASYVGKKNAQEIRRIKRSNFLMRLYKFINDE